MLNQHQSSLRLVARLALLRARLAAVEEKNAVSRPLTHHLLLPRALATEAAASCSSPSAGQAGAASTRDQHHEQYREYAFALTPEQRRVTVVAANANATAAAAAPTPVLVSTSADPERIVIRASPLSNWTVELGPQGPEAREESSRKNPPPSSDAPPPPLEVALPPRFCGLDIRSAGGDVTVSGSGVQEADVRIIVHGTSTTVTTPTITATRLRCGELVLDAGPSGRVSAKEVAASRLEVRGGRGVELGRVSALEALVEAGENLEIGALYGRAAVLRLAGRGGGGGATTTAATTLPLLRVNQLSCGGDGDSDEQGQQQGATIEAWPRGSNPIAVRVDGALSGRATVASGRGPVTLAAVQASGGLRALVVDSGGGDVDVSMDTGGGGGGRGLTATATATLRLQGASELSVDPALGLSEDDGCVVPVYGPGARDSHISIDAGGGGRVLLKARSWMDGVMQRAREAAAARERER